MRRPRLPAALLCAAALLHGASALDPAQILAPEGCCRSVLENTTVYSGSFDRIFGLPTLTACHQLCSDTWFCAGFEWKVVGGGVTFCDIHRVTPTQTHQSPECGSCHYMGRVIDPGLNATCGAITCGARCFGGCGWDSSSGMCKRSTDGFVTTPDEHTAGVCFSGSMGAACNATFPPITSAAVCEDAAKALELNDTEACEVESGVFRCHDATVRDADASALPDGCYYNDDAGQNPRFLLWYNPSGNTSFDFDGDDRYSLCGGVDIERVPQPPTPAPTPAPTSAPTPSGISLAGGVPEVVVKPETTQSVLEINATYTASMRVRILVTVKNASGATGFVLGQPVAIAADITDLPPQGVAAIRLVIGSWVREGEYVVQAYLLPAKGTWEQRFAQSAEHAFDIVYPTAAPTVSPTTSPTNAPTVAPTLVPSKDALVEFVELSSTERCHQAALEQRSDDIFSLGGGNHTLERCTRRCLDQTVGNCTFFVYTVTGFCHMFKSCENRTTSDVSFRMFLRRDAITPAPTATPSNAPSASPSDAPSDAPTRAPVPAPTPSPTVAPTITPTSAPSDTPTATPVDVPTHVPSTAPSHAPTQSPVVSDAPSVAPSVSPTESTTSGVSTVITTTIIIGNGDDQSSSGGSASQSSNDTTIIAAAAAGAAILLLCCIVFVVFARRKRQRKQSDVPKPTVRHGTLTFKPHQPQTPPSPNMLSPDLMRQFPLGKQAGSTDTQTSTSTAATDSLRSAADAPMFARDGGGDASEEHDYAESLPSHITAKKGVSDAYDNRDDISKRSFPVGHDYASTEGSKSASRGGSDDTTEEAYYAAMPKLPKEVQQELYTVPHDQRGDAQRADDDSAMLVKPLPSTQGLVIRTDRVMELERTNSTDVTPASSGEYGFDPRTRTQGSEASSTTVTPHGTRKPMYEKPTPLPPGIFDREYERGEHRQAHMQDDVSYATPMGAASAVGDGTTTTKGTYNGGRYDEFLDKTLTAGSDDYDGFIGVNHLGTHGGYSSAHDRTPLDTTLVRQQPPPAYSTMPNDASLTAAAVTQDYADGGADERGRLQPRHVTPTTTSASPSSSSQRPVGTGYRVFNDGDSATPKVRASYAEPEDSMDGSLRGANMYAQPQDRNKVPLDTAGVYGTPQDDPRPSDDNDLVEPYARRPGHAVRVDEYAQALPQTETYASAREALGVSDGHVPRHEERVSTAEMRSRMRPVSNHVYSEISHVVYDQVPDTVVPRRKTQAEDQQSSVDTTATVATHSRPASAVSGTVVYETTESAAAAAHAAQAEEDARLAPLYASVTRPAAMVVNPTSKPPPPPTTARRKKKVESSLSVPGNPAVMVPSNSGKNFFDVPLADSLKSSKEGHVQLRDSPDPSTSTDGVYARGLAIASRDSTLSQASSPGVVMEPNPDYDMTMLEINPDYETLPDLST